MGTRGAYGFIKNGQHKVSYNHFDSYPDGLGNDILNYLDRYTIKQINNHFDAIELVNEDSQPTKEQIEKCAGTSDFSVSNRSKQDWYCLLKGAQGNLAAHARVGYMVDAYNFLLDGLFCEYAYIINLDDKTLEIYKGFQKKPPKGRYSDAPRKSGYYAVGLVKTFPLGKKCPKIFTEENLPELMCDNE